MRVWAIIVAAGTGTRFLYDHETRNIDASLPKQFQTLGNKSVLDHTLAAFDHHAYIDQICVVVHGDHQARVEAVRPDYAKLEMIVEGGASRQASVYCGLRALASKVDPADIVLIHDGVRPIISAQLIDRVIESAQQCGAAIPALCITDTLKIAPDGDYVKRTISRAGHYQAQTPQAFRFDQLYKAHHNMHMSANQATDDAALLEEMGYKIRLVEGDVDNIKITHFQDLLKLRHRMRNMETRTGIGYDVHAIEPDKDTIILCGIALPHTFGLLGHSDADVAMHAITDALYGALAQGDIGQHFPPDDPAHKDQDSEIFLAHAIQLAHQSQARIIHIDLTILAEAPKIAPHAVKMRTNIARICGIHHHRVSIKATTVEKLGFVGRQEGLAAMATATVEMPANV